nr:hypothetical protein [Micromonospora sp. DSM 115978]
VGLGVLCLLLFVGCAAVLSSAGDELAEATQPVDGVAGASAPDGLFQHPEDVQIAGCTVDEALSWPVATLTITNQSSKASSYLITVSFQSPDGATLFGEGFATVTSLAPGQATTQEAKGLFELPADTPFGCVVTSAMRNEATP